MTRPASPSRAPPPPTHEPAAGPGGASRTVDLVVAVLLVLLAASVAWVRPEGDTLRLVVAAPIVLVVPGYLVLQAAFVPARPARQRAIHALFAVGLSPIVLGLLALTTALVPSGFQTGPIVAAVTVACLALAGVAGYRRASQQGGTGPDEPTSGRPGNAGTAHRPRPPQR